ncbi:MAG: SCO family protein [Opitutaceae bacterium]|nr:SCO family protein [Opitutaceae bacterium]
MKTALIAKVVSGICPALATLVLDAGFAVSAPMVHAADACCAAATATAEAAADRSIYQLEATWITDAGKPFRLEELRGRPVVLAMFFASCGYACPRIVNDMTQIRQTLAPAVRDHAVFVLVSFDDERDTVAALHAYREAHELASTNWMLLRGAPGDIRELAAVLGVSYKKNALGMFDHSNLITVLSPEGEITHQRAGLEGGLAETARAVVAAR